MPARYRDVQIEPSGASVGIHFLIENQSGAAWKPDAFSIGWQFFDPVTNRFIMEGEWTPLPAETKPGESAEVRLTIPFPPEPGAYRVYVSPIEQPAGWAYGRGDAFLAVDVAVANEQAKVVRHELTTTRALRLRNLRRTLPALFTLPVSSIFRNRRLIASMARRDILARYRGSFGDIFWTILNPLILMATYFFVFGVVLRTRSAPEQSSTGFALYFLAGMLPWLAFSEAAGRSPQVIVEHRNFVKKLIFPLETLPVNHVLAGLITELFAIALFLAALLLIHHSVPLTVLWLPALIVPQILFTLGICWFLAALGVFFRDLGQIMGFLLTLWFFITPICYPEASLPQSAMVILRKNPIFVLVHAYRAVLLDGQPPSPLPLIKLTIVAVLAFLLGHAFFYKLRKSFADVI
jgi:lipopolysaccharide transport system permease protein